MKKHLTSMLIALGLIATACSSEEPKGNEAPIVEANEDVKPLPTTKDIVLSRSEEDAMNRFADVSFKMSAKIAENYNKIFENATDDNYNFSPISAIMCLSLIANSVDANTSEMIVDKLGIGSLEKLNNLNTKLLQYLPAKENAVDLRLANSVWYHNKCEISKSYKNEMAKIFAASVYGCDFTSSKSVDEVNAWVARNTENMIPGIINDLSIDAQALFVNAMYFAGNWMYEFNESNTKDGSFHGSRGDSSVKMMHGNFDLGYYADSEIEAVVLPFSRQYYELNILMPSDGCKTPLTSDRFKEVMNNLSGKQVNLKMPRFDIEKKAALTPMLQAMDISLSKYTLDPMGFNTDANIGMQIIQKTKIIVNEEGAKAAAATYGAPITSNGTKLDRVTMTVDRPFYYVIRNVKTGAIAMMGRLCNM